MAASYCGHVRVAYNTCLMGTSKTTARYTRVSSQVIARTESPLDRLLLKVTPPE